MFLVFVFCFSTQDWWDGVKNTMEKPVFDKKRMGDMFEEMFASLGDGDAAGHGTFRKKFIKVWGAGGFVFDAFIHREAKASHRSMRELWCCAFRDKYMVSCVF